MSVEWMFRAYHSEHTAVTAVRVGGGHGTVRVGGERRCSGGVWGIWEVRVAPQRCARTSLAFALTLPERRMPLMQHWSAPPGSVAQYFTNLARRHTHTSRIARKA